MTVEAVVRRGSQASGRRVPNGESSPAAWHTQATRVCTPCCYPTLTELWIEAAVLALLQWLHLFAHPIQLCTGCGRTAAVVQARQRQRARVARTPALQRITSSRLASGRSCSPSAGPVHIPAAAVRVASEQQTRTAAQPQGAARTQGAVLLLPLPRFFSQRAQVGRAHRRIRAVKAAQAEPVPIECAEGLPGAVCLPLRAGCRHGGAAATEGGACSSSSGGVVVRPCLTLCMSHAASSCS